MRRRTHYVVPTATRTACGLPLKRGQRRSDSPTCPACARIRTDAYALLAVQRQLADARARIEFYTRPGTIAVVFSSEKSEPLDLSRRIQRYTLEAQTWGGERRCVQVDIDDALLDYHRRNLDRHILARSVDNGWRQLLEDLRQRFPSVFGP